MATERKFTISGPGAADFLTAQSGEDMPGSSSSKGMSQTRDESITSDARNFEPAFGSDDDARSAERNTGGPSNPSSDDRTGSQTGTIGGGGADAHNPDPVRATGVDDPTANDTSKPGRKRTTKKY